MKTLAACAALLWPISGFADGDDGGRGDEAYIVKLSLKVGQLSPMCDGITTQCPVYGPFCDDVKIVSWAEGANGTLAWKGVSRGTTLCSVGPTSLQGAGRRQYRITVR